MTNWGPIGPGRSGAPAPRTAGGAQPDPRAFGDFSSFFLHLFGPDSPFGPLEGRTRRAPGWPPSGRYRPPGPPADAPGRTGVVEISLEEAYRGAIRQLHTSEADSYRVRIPPGVRDGARLKVRTPDGDAMLAVRIASHPRFRREGDNLEVEVPVRFAEAALGGEIEVPTLADPVRIRMPGGDLRRRGAPRARDGACPVPAGVTAIWSFGSGLRCRKTSPRNRRTSSAASKPARRPQRNSAGSDRTHDSERRPPAGISAGAGKRGRFDRYAARMGT